MASNKVSRTIIFISNFTFVVHIEELYLDHFYTLKLLMNYKMRKILVLDLFFVTSAYFQNEENQAKISYENYNHTLWK